MEDHAEAPSLLIPVCLLDALLVHNIADVLTCRARPNPQQLPALLQKCTDDLYQWQRDTRENAEPFVIHDGPPYANGPLHIGHALNKILKDMILRFNVQQGKKVVYRPSWDCHGLPIELKTLEGASSEGRKPSHIRSAARRLASKTIKTQMKAFKSYGVMAEWDNPWTTMDKDYELRQLDVFKTMVQRGLIYRRHKPVYWSPSSRTALAEAELEYKEDHLSKAAYVKFLITSEAGALPGLENLDCPLYAAIWTTTPWTLPANMAIGVHDDLMYSVVRVGDAALLVASARVESLSQVLSGAQLVAEGITGSQLRGLTYRNKLRGRSAALQSLIHADFVTAHSGTGLVHLAPGHGQDDYERCSQLGIEAFAPIRDDGTFTEEAYPDDPAKLTAAPSVLAGGGSAVLDLVGDDVLHVHEYRHKYPYDWRTKLPVVIRATAQWFADVGSVKSDALAAMTSVKFKPDSGRGRLESFIKGRSEWCISRQRSWGVPIPVFYDESGKAVMTGDSIDHVISVMRQRGSDAWFSDAPDEPAWISSSLNGSYRRGSDTMDVWFDSGTSWTETGKTADIYLEGSDQHRGWFQSSLLTRVATESPAAAPFKTLITHGFALDAQGKKMSKSIGNTVSPEQVMDGSLLPPMKVKGKQGGPPRYDALGVDALRLWAASCDYTSDVLIGPSVLQPIQAQYIRYRNTLKMLLGSLHESSRVAPLTGLDQLALVSLEDTMKDVKEAFQEHDFHKALGLINRWISSDLSAFYIEALKDRLYCGDGGGAIEPVFIGLLGMLAPITPVLVEEAWSFRPEWMKSDE